MNWLVTAVVAVGAFYLGRNYSSLKTAVDNRTKIEGASEVVTGLGKIFG